MVNAHNKRIIIIIVMIIGREQELSVSNTVSLSLYKYV